MDKQIVAFLDEIDRELARIAPALNAPDTHLDLYLLGRASLVIQHRFQVSTRDIDFVETRTSVLETAALQLFGQNTKWAQTLGLYLDPVAEGLPPLPNGYKKRCVPIPGSWAILRIWALDDHDLAASKLKRFHTQDREDIQFLCDLGNLNAMTLRSSLDKAFPDRSPKAEDAEHDPDTPEWGRCLKNFYRVEAYLNGKSRSI